MTPNEARQVLNQYRAQARRRDVLGKVARDEMKAAYITLARYSVEVALRFGPNRRAAYLEMAGFYREAAAEIMEVGK